MAVLFILSPFIMPSEGHFGIRYDMDFLSPLFFHAIYSRSSLPSRLCFCTVEWAFYLWQYLTQRSPVS